MSIAKFAENYYTFRQTIRIFDTLHQPLTPEQTALAAIEAQLTLAHNAYLAHNYQGAIPIYKEVERLLFTQIYPSFPYSFHGGDALLPDGMPRHPKLFEPFLSASLEWLNVLPVRQPLTMAQSRLTADPDLLRDAIQFESVGLSSNKLAPGTVMQATADFQLAQALNNGGNASAGNFFLRRAQATAPETVRLLQATHEEAVVADPAIPAVAPGNRREQQIPFAAHIAVEGNLGVSGISLKANRNRMAAVADVSVTGRGLGTPVTPLPPQITESRSVGLLINREISMFPWNVGDAPPLETIRSAVYERRITSKDLISLTMFPYQPADVAVNLAHNYFYVVPLGLAECYHALGQFEKAEKYYFQAASYAYLSTEVEAPYIWIRLCSLYLDWGNFLFRQDLAVDAFTIYERVLRTDGNVPDSTLYTTVALKPGSDVGQAVIADLALFLQHADDDAVVVPDLNPTIVATILEVHQQLLKIAAGLDFWGHWHQTVPIWTFDYLQSVAINFAQFAISAERDFISFQSHADESQLTRQQLVQNVSQAKAEVNATTMASKAAAAEVDVYTIGVDLANKRAQDAKDSANQYAAMSADQIVRQAVAAQLSGGDDGDSRDLNSRADTLMGIGPTAEYIREHPGNWRMEGSAATLSATEQLVAARRNRQYEVDLLNRQGDELAVAGAQAQAELTVANARAAAAKAGVAVAQVRATAASDSLAAFDDQFFTPDVWWRMGDTMLRLYRRYFDMSLRAARLMQQAYNFETDQAIQMIRSDYSIDEVKGLLGADLLMADIQSFSYNLITSTASKPQPLRQTISLAERYGYLFETQLRTTGIMNFETVIDDFDVIYPGTYAGRIESVEVEVLGIVPVTGISGTLTNDGISAYRIPAAAWPAPTATGLKYRLQSRETLVISDYFTRQDALLVANDVRMTKIFQGAGLASTWRLELPKAINDIDYRALTDVRLTFYYKARFDPELQSKVLAQLADRPGLNARQRGIPLRWIYPDAFFRFQDTGELRFTLRARDFRRNETAPILQHIGVFIVTDGILSPADLKVTLSTPAHPEPLLATTDGQGAVVADDPAWTDLVGGTALGEYIVALPTGDNPGLIPPDPYSPIVNIALIMGYSFTPAG